MTENPPLFRRKEGDSSFDRVFSEVVHVDRQFLKGFGEFLFALGHVEGDPEALVGVTRLRNKDLTESLSEERISQTVKRMMLQVKNNVYSYRKKVWIEKILPKWHQGAIGVMGKNNAIILKNTVT